jgi:N-methylhydantoinase A
MNQYVVAVDIGGTFTDVTMTELDTGAVWSLKTATTRRDPSIGFLNGVEKVLLLADAGPEDVVRVLHGTTIATNAILESTGAPTGLVTTRGFKFVLEIGRHNLPGRANALSWVKPKRPVRPESVREVSGRIAADGSELEPLSET